MVGDEVKLYSFFSLKESEELFVSPSHDDKVEADSVTKHQNHGMLWILIVYFRVTDKASDLLLRLIKPQQRYDEKDHNRLASPLCFHD
ncbi:hypothetical protein NQZ68_012666 [Dissostichus eleginoides]|nr:hypothetical protein NQZ68_012666 [Dissostichus eleginoides]